MKFAWLVVWNLVFIALVCVVPVMALLKAGWFAAAFIAGLAVFALALRHPAFVLGAWLGHR